MEVDDPRVLAFARYVDDLERRLADHKASRRWLDCVLVVLFGSAIGLGIAAGELALMSWLGWLS